MSTQLVFIFVTAAAAALVLAGALLAALRDRAERRSQLAAEHLAPSSADAPLPLDPADPDRQAQSTARRALRVAWWLSILAVLIGVGLSDAFPANRQAIYLLGAAAGLLVVVLHEVLPANRRGPIAAGVEIGAGMALASGLVALTGFAESPFVFAYHLLAVAVALSLGATAALAVASASALAYLGVLLLDPARSLLDGDDPLRLAINAGSLLLVAYMAGVFASSERTLRRSVLEFSQIDTLTGLFNRARLFATLDQEVQRTRRSSRGFCVLMIDLDGLKAVNDSLGHQRGDEVLRALATVIRRAIRTVDSAYRYGGDEFLVLLPETDYTGAFVVAEKVRIGVEEVGGAFGEGELLTSVSIGLVSHPEDGSTVEELMLAADRAMYNAKSLGKNQISGNPRPRRQLQALTMSPLGTPAPEPVMPPMPEAAAPEAAVDETPAPEPMPSTEPAGVAAANTAGSQTNGTAAEIAGDEEPDPTEVRRQIAAARRNMDPDHQIRRAMDAFLSPARPGSEPE